MIRGILRFLLFGRVVGLERRFKIGGAVDEGDNLAFGVDVFVVVIGLIGRRDAIPNKNDGSFQRIVRVSGVFEAYKILPINKFLFFTRANQDER
jgi:hypothetical protein